jgi:hypothetical protein
LLNGLVISQTGVLTVLLAAGLTVVSFLELMRVNPGFATQNRLSFVLATSRMHLLRRQNVSIGKLAWPDASRRVYISCNVISNPIVSYGTEQSLL